MAILFGFHELKLKQLISSRIPEVQSIEFDSLFSKNDSLKEAKVFSPIINQHPLLLPSIKDEVVNIAGIYLPVLSKKPNSNIPLVEVTSTINNLHKIALGLLSNKAICLLGPVGSGKTSLIEYLAVKTGRILGVNFVKVQLANETDSKMLLGTYKCTDIPGEFVWQPGVLTQVRYDCYMDMKNISKLFIFL